MAKAATRTAPKPAVKTAPKPATKSAIIPSKAAQAAQHQGRPEPEPRREPAQPRQMPAVQQPHTLVDPATVAHLPAFMRDDVNVGKEAIKQEDLEIPRLKLIQGVSKELQEYDSLRPGHFFHPSSEMIFDEPFRAVVLHMDRRYILWRPLEDGGGILARADDGVHWSPGEGEFTVKLDRKDGGDQVTWKLAKTVQQSGLANWGTMNSKNSNSPPAATLMFNYLLAFPDHPEVMPAILTFQRSGIREGRKFNTKIKTVFAPIYGSVYEFSARPASNSANQDYFEIAVKGAGLVEDENLFNQYRSMYKSFSNTGLNIKDIESLQNDDPTDNTADDDRPKM